jgi:hypothetical protein
MKIINHKGKLNMETMNKEIYTFIYPPSKEINEKEKVLDLEKIAENKKLHYLLLHEATVFPSHLGYAYVTFSEGKNILNIYNLNNKIKLTIYRNGNLILNDPMIPSSSIINYVRILNAILMDYWIEKIEDKPKEKILDLKKLENSKLCCTLLSIACGYKRVIYDVSINNQGNKLEIFNTYIGESIVVYLNGDVFRYYNGCAIHNLNQEKIRDFLKPYWVE